MKRDSVTGVAVIAFCHWTCHGLIFGHRRRYLGGVLGPRQPSGDTWPILPGPAVL
jgi:hypothetical protein